MLSTTVNLIVGLEISHIPPTGQLQAIHLSLNLFQGGSTVTISYVEMTSASLSSSNMTSFVSHVENATCQVGYEGLSCERCSQGTLTLILSLSLLKTTLSKATYPIPMSIQTLLLNSLLRDIELSEQIGWQPFHRYPTLSTILVFLDLNIAF